MKILQIIIDPIIKGKSLSKRYNVDVQALHKSVLDELTSITGEEMIIVDSITDTDIPVKEDGYQYTEDELYNVLFAGGKSHRPDWLDYTKFIEKFDLINRKNRGDFNEVHIYGFPWCGAFESRMVGRTAVYCNSGAYSANCDNFIIMGFSYERQISEAVEAFGHRSEFILQRCYPNSFRLMNNLVGSIHIPFNTKKDYDWGNTAMVDSYAHVFPDGLSTDFYPVKANCELWGNKNGGYGLNWFRFWFKHLPKSAWDVILHPEKIRVMEE